jgi:lysophospholipid acyltransferase (LPLAT)-like uncharacterized protein
MHRSWDRLKIPHPFSPVYVCYGEPLIIPNDISDSAFDAALVELNQRLGKLEIVAAAAAQDSSSVTARHFSESSST